MFYNPVLFIKYVVARRESPVAYWDIAFAVLVHRPIGAFDSVLYVDGLLDEIGCLEHKKGVWGNVLVVLRLGDFRRWWTEVLEKRRGMSLG
jgi:hypothetical protein